MIRIKGHSNFNVQLYSYNNTIVIKKSSNNSDFPRLEKQINKQKFFYNLFYYSNEFQVPKIISQEKNSFIMEYIEDSNSIIEFLQSANKNKILWLSNLLIKFISNNIKQSSFQNKLPEFLDKYQDVKKKCIEKYSELNNLFNKIDYYFKNLEDMIIPEGICHGDLTLSNILICFDNQKLYLIDFLDNFIDSSLQDIVKIRQDTLFHWSLKLFNKEPIDKNKIIINLNYMDSIIHNHFKRYDFYNKYYNYFQILNILRILQYCKDNSIKQNLINNIYKCL